MFMKKGNKIIFVVILLSFSLPLIMTYNVLNEGFDTYIQIPYQGRYITGHRDAYFSEYLFISFMWMLLFLVILFGLCDKKKRVS